ncbi:hypothetical protein ES703_36852 [subsurface metagenome]
MAETKYGHLVKTMPVNEGPKGANAYEIIWMFGKELENFPLNFALGRYEETGIWHPWSGPHVHPTYDECLLFFGHDTDDPASLGAEFEIALGEEQEKHVFNTPSVVILPKGTPHCPLVTKRIDKSFAHGHIILGPDDKVDWWPTDSKPKPTNGSKYNHLIKPLNIQKGPKTTELVWMASDQLEGFDLHFAVGLCAETGPWYPGKGAHTHPYDKCMIFLGHDTKHLGYLGAEIEVALGSEEEKHTFDVPTVVTVPRGLSHLPPVVKKVDKPFGFIIYNLGPKHEVTWVD